MIVGMTWPAVAAWIAGALLSALILVLLLEDVWRDRDRH
jgi:hypothetical protein